MLAMNSYRVESPFLHIVDIIVIGILQVKIITIEIKYLLIIIIIIIANLP